MPKHPPIAHRHRAHAIGRRIQKVTHLAGCSGGVRYGDLVEQPFRGVGGARQEIRDHLLADARVGDDGIEIRHQQSFCEHRKISGRAAIQVKSALADDVGVVGRVLAGVAHQGTKPVLLCRLELGARRGSSHQKLPPGMSI